MLFKNNSLYENKKNKKQIKKTYVLSVHDLDFVIYTLKNKTKTV